MKVYVLIFIQVNFFFVLFYDIDDDSNECNDDKKSHINIPICYIYNIQDLQI